MTRRLTKAGLMCAVVVLATVGTDIYAQTLTSQAAKWCLGPDDEIGTLNLMTQESRLAILSQISTGRVYDLSQIPRCPRAMRYT